MKYIKKFFRECFRYKLSGVSMVACLILSMLAAYYGITIFKNIYYEHKESTEYAYQYTTSFNCKADSISEFPTLPEGVDCNLKLSDYEMYLSDANSTHLVQIILHSEDENWPLVSGHFPNSKEINQNEKLILIGQALSEDAYKENGTLYYDVFGDKYKVVGVLGSKNSVIFDYYVVLYADCLGEHTKQMMEENDLNNIYNMVLESNTKDTEEIFNTYIKNNYAASIHFGSSVINASATPMSNEKEFCIIIYLFCFVCIAVVMKFWIMQRTHEMQVCKAFGYNNLRIIFRLLRSFGCMLLFSLSVFSICCSTINWIFKDSLKEYHLEFSWNILLPYLFVFLIAILAVSIKPVYKLITKSIAGTMRER